jgi:hypothetical protein
MTAYSRAWVGWIFFATSLMLLIGLFQVLMGAVALFDEPYFRTAKDDLLVAVDHTTWGLTHIGLGAVTIVAGFGVMLAQRWARVLAIALAVVSVFANLAFLAVTPLWNLSIVVFDIVVIYALIVHGPQVEDAAFDR